jgi:hypothetical protein
MYQHFTMDWTRGAADHDGEFVVLRSVGTDIAPRALYEPQPGPRRAFDLAQVRTPADIVWFMERHGPLWDAGFVTLVDEEPYEGQREVREKVADWLAEGANVARLLGMYATLWEMCERATGDAVALADQLSLELRNSCPPVVTRVLWAGPHEPGEPWKPAFERGADGGSLIAMIYNDLAELVSQGCEVRACIACGRFFVAEDRLDRCCSAPCAHHARYGAWPALAPRPCP